VYLIGAMVCLLAAPWIQLSISAGNGSPHNALWHHWLMAISCHFRDCKVLLAPSYLADDCILASSDKFRRRLRLADVDTCIVPRTRTHFGDWNFSAAGPRIWNSLPPELRRPDTELGEFRRSLKTFLFV